LAEQQVAEGGKSTVVSVKTNAVAGQKRKTREAESADKEKKKNRRSMNKKGNR
jgi:hypothetical protein